MAIQKRMFEVLKPTPWIENDCKVKECDEGYITEEGMLFKCPSCDRASIRNLLTSRKHLRHYTPYEMEERKKERERVVYDRDYRLQRNKKMIDKINGLLKTNGNGNGNGKASYLLSERHDEEEIPF